MQEKIKEWAAHYGVTATQVQSGVGTVLTVIQSRTPSAEWQKLAAKVPEVLRWAKESPTINAPAVGGAGQAPRDSDLLLAALGENGFGEAAARQFVASVLSALEPVLGKAALGNLPAEFPGGI